jgi:hypothetical protein
VQLKKRQAELVFSKLRLEVQDSHHKMATLYHAGRAILRTRVSNGRGDIPPVIVAKLRGQLHVSEDQLSALVDCTMTYGDYIEVLRKKGLLD